MRLFNPQIIGAQVLDPAITWRARGLGNATPSITVSGVDFGAAVKGNNQKWGVCCMFYYSDATISVTGTTIAGVAAPIIYQQTIANTYSSTNNAVVFAARIDDVTSGDVVWTDDTALNGYYDICTLTNLDGSTVSDSAIAAGATTASLSIDCAAGGGILGQCIYFGASGDATSVAFANLTGQSFYDDPGGSTGHAFAGSTFASAQTGLSVSCTPSPANRRPTAFALSFNGV